MFKRYPFVQGMIGIVIGVVTFVAKKVRKRRFCAMPLYKPKRSFYQDRFGTNIHRESCGKGDLCVFLQAFKYEDQVFIVKLQVRKTAASFFECFPYVCPEPVLAK